MISTRMKVSDIKIGDRYRKDLGDINGLMKSIEEIGLLQPIVVDTATHELIAGMRRLEACKRLGWTEISVRLVNLAEVNDES